MRRIAPAVGLFLLAPLVAEFLLGNLPITMIGALVVLAPMYGGGALLIRELVRRTGRGWPTIVLLAVAYGVLEEGIATQSLFNPNYVGLRLLDYGFIPALGIAGPWTLFVLALHTVWSISVPILLVETLATGRRTTPWLGPVGLGVAAALFAVGVAVTALVSVGQDSFVATAPQFLAVGVVIVGLTFAAFRLQPTGAPTSVVDQRHAPRPWIVGVVAMGAGVTFFLLTYVQDRVPVALVVLAFLVLFGAVIVAVRRWSRAGGWGEPHRVALAGAALLTYAWHSFPESSLGQGNERVDLIGNAVFAAGAVALLVVAARAARRASGTPLRVPAGGGRSL